MSPYAAETPNVRRVGESPSRLLALACDLQNNEELNKYKNL